MIVGILILLIVAVVLALAVWAMFRKRPADANPEPTSTKPPATSTANPFAPAEKLYAKRQYAEGAEAYRLALRANPGVKGVLVAHFRFVECLDAAGRRDEAQREVEKLGREVSLSSAASEKARVQALLDKRKGDLLSAYANLERAVDTTPKGDANRNMMIFELATISASLGRHDLTHYWSTQGIAAGIGSTTYPGFLTLAGLSSLKLGDVDQAERFYREKLQIVRNKEDIQGIGRGLANLSQVLCARGDYAQGIPMAEQAVEIYSDDPQAMCQAVLASHLAVVGRYADAIKTIDDRLGSLPPGRVRVVEQVTASLTNMKVVYLALSGDIDEAWHAFNAVTDRPTPKHEIAFATLGAWLAALHSEPDAAARLEAASRAVEISAMDESSLRPHRRELVKAAVLVGNIEVALSNADKLVNQPQPPTDLTSAWYHAGEANRLAGNIDTARDCYKRAAAYGFANVTDTKSRARLAELS